MKTSYCVYLLLFLFVCAPIAKLHAQTSKVILENDKVRVLEYTAKPHEGVCGTGMHSHPAHLTVILQPAKVRVTLPDGKTVEKEPKGDLVFWSEAGTHSVENIDTVSRHSLLIEVKEPGNKRKRQKQLHLLDTRT